MPKVFAFIFLSFFSISSLFAQGFSVSGVVRDSVNQEPLIGVNLMLVLQKDKETKTYVTTDLEGAFQFQNIAPGIYTLSATYVGYTKYTQTVNVKNSPVNLGNLRFSPSVQVLEGLVIEAKTKRSLQIGDTTQFNADAFKTAFDASGQDLVEKMPGIALIDGKIQAQGEDVQQILVDGKPFFGNDVQVALQSLPAGIIASVQVYDKKSDKALLSGFDDGESTKTINIITKPSRRKGLFGKASVGYGSDDKYQIGASVNFFNEDRRVTVTGLSNDINRVNYSSDPNSQGESQTQNGIIETNSIGINFGDEWGEKIEFSGSYLFSHRENEVSVNRLRDFVLPSDSGRVYTEDNYSHNSSDDHRFRARFEYNIDTNNRLIIRPSISINFDENNDNFLGRTITDYGPVNQTENVARQNLSNYDFDNSLYYSHRFRKKGRSFTFGLRTGYHMNEDNEYRTADNIFYNKEDSTETINQHSHRERTGVSWEAQVSYTEPVGKNSMVELEYQIGDRINDSDKLTYNILEEESGSYNELDTALSNTFESAYMTQEVELGYQYRVKDFRVQVEAEYQHAALKNDQNFPKPFELGRNFQSLLPSVRLDYEFTRSKKLEFDYRTWTSEPSIGQLQDVIDNSNPLQLSTGNPDLDQSKNSWLRLRYRANNTETDQSLYTAIGSSFTRDYVANATFIATEPTTLEDGIILEEGSQLTKPVNVDGYWNIYSYFSYGRPFELLKSNINFNGSINYSKRPGVINNETNFSKSSNFRLGLSLSSNINENVDFNISTRSSYNITENSLRPALSNNYFNQTSRLKLSWVFLDGFVYRTNLNHEVNTGLASGYDNNALLLNMSLGKKFLKNDLAEISLNVYDLLEQNNNIRRNITESYIEDVQSTVLQRYFMLTFTYNIRHFSKGSSMKDFEEIQMN